MPLCNALSCSRGQSDGADVPPMAPCVLAVDKSSAASKPPCARAAPPQVVSGILPCGLRISRSGQHVVVAQQSSNAVAVLRAQDGEAVSAWDLLALTSGAAHYPYDVEECEGGWLAACGYTHQVRIF